MTCTFETETPFKGNFLESRLVAMFLARCQNPTNETLRIKLLKDVQLM